MIHYTLCTMLFPLSDDDRRITSTMWVTIILLVMNVAMYLYQTVNPAVIMSLALIPQELTSGEDLIGPMAYGEDEMMHLKGPSPLWLTLFTSMFMHGSWMHLGGNMLYLWIFGDNVEHRFGSFCFLIFYLISGLAATAAQVVLAPDSTIPNVGASGAISGIMGAYLILFPRNKVNVIFIIRIISIPAFLVLGVWIGMQIFSGYKSLNNVGLTGGVAYGAHVGGFIAGVISGVIARLIMKEEPDSALKRQYALDTQSRKIW